MCFRFGNCCLGIVLGNFWENKLTETIKGFPNDVCDCWEMDRQEGGWYFDRPEPDVDALALLEELLQNELRDGIVRLDELDRTNAENQLDTHIHEAITKCCVVVKVDSPEYGESTWTTKEYTPVATNAKATNGTTTYEEWNSGPVSSTRAWPMDSLLG